MGLDAVEIIMRTEESFGLCIPDKEAATMKSVGDLYEYVLSQTKSKGMAACISQAAFYKLRAALLTLTKTDRNEIRPQTKLKTLFPRKRRASYWYAIQQQTRLTLPALNYPRSVLIAFLLSCIVLILFLLRIHALHNDLGFLAIVTILLPLIFIAALDFSPFLATAFPPGKTTLGDLTHSVVGLNYGKLAEHLNMQDEKAVWSAIQQIVSDQLQIDAAEITYGASWRDLGVD